MSVPDEFFETVPKEIWKGLAVMFEASIVEIDLMKRLLEKKKYQAVMEGVSHQPERLNYYSQIFGILQKLMSEFYEKGSVDWSMESFALSVKSAYDVIVQIEDFIKVENL